jgi:transposase
MVKNHREHEIPLEERGEMVGLRKAGWTLEMIADELKCSVNAVRYNLEKKKKFGSTIDRPRSGRPRVTCESQDKYIRVASLMDRFRPAHEIAQNVFKRKSKKTVSNQTVRNRLVEAGLNGRIARNKPKLTKKQRQARLRWAKKYQSWKAQDFEKILWSDESPFNLFVKNGKVWVRRREGEEYVPCCMQPTVKFGGGHINVWGCFSGQGVGPLYQIHGNMNGAMYREILKNQMAPHLRSLGAGFTFQHDNDPKHTSKVVKNYLSNAKFTVMEWPSQSPDLNPIENLWGRIKQRLRKRPLGPSSLNDIYDFVKTEWNALEKDYLLDLIHSMPRRIEAVIENKGGSTKY